MTRRSRLGFLPTVLILLIAHFSVLTASAQSATATLSGTVEDQNQAVVPGARVKVINLSTGLERDAATNDSGSFTILLLQPSTYTVRVERDGFVTIEVSNVVLNVGDERSLRIEMKVGDVKEIVNVTGEESLINESPAVGTVINRQFVQNLPLNGRSFQSLIALTPGTVLTKANATEAGQFSVNGQRADANYFTVDGVSGNVGVSGGASPGQSAAGALPGLSAAGGTNTLVPVDALQEFRIQTSTFAPEFGRTPGAQVSLITRSGTNQFHGMVFEYFRNDKLDANNWFNNANRLPKSPMRQNDFGGVFGGPLYLPRFGEGGPSFLSGKNRTFLFFSYEGLRLRQPQTTIVTVPSLNSRQIAPAGVQPFLRAFPIPNGASLTLERAQFAGSYSNPSTVNATGIRVDHTVKDKLSGFGRFSSTPSENSVRQGVLVALFATKVRTKFFTAGVTWTPSSKLSNDFRANYSWNSAVSALTIDNFGGAIPLQDSDIFPSFASRENAAYAFSITGVGGFNVGKNSLNRQRQLNLVDSLSWIVGSHDLKFGIDYRRLTPEALPVAYGQTIIFSGVTGATGPTVGTALSGRAQVVQIIANADPRHLLLTNFSAFGQDTWKVSRRLTLTYGLRLDVNTPPKERSGNQYALVGIDNPATMTISARGAALWKTTYDNLAPRFGVAYRLREKAGRETMLRGGVGMFYDLGTSDAAIGFGSNVFPYTTAKTLSNEPYPLSAASAQPPIVNTVLPTTSQFFGSDPNLKLPRIYQWNFTVEQSLGANQVFSASYVGAVGRRLLRRDILNRPNSSFGNLVQVRRNTATSDYHAMQLQFQRRMTRGLQVLASYTWAHSIDTSSNDSGAFAPSGKVNIAQERGPSDFDVRHAFSWAVTYNFPKPAVGEAAGWILRNWSTDLIFTARTATPVDVLVGTDVLAVGSPFLSRPDLISGVPLYLYGPQYPGGRIINNTVPTAAQIASAGCLSTGVAKGPFCTPSSARQGTLSRNALRGFSVNQLDWTLRRQFNLTERVNLQLRAEFFNLFNHPNFGDPQGTLTNALFGQSTQMLSNSLGAGGTSSGLNPLYQIGGPRSIQFALKLGF